MRNDIITRIETTLTPDGQGGWTEETIETGSFDVKLSIGANVEEATAYGVSVEQILKVIADVPLLEDESSLYIIQGPEGKQGPAGSVDFDSLTPEQMEMLRGPQGEPGRDGLDGKDGEPGKDGKDAEFPPGGRIGDLLVKAGGTNTEWLPPEQAVPYPNLAGGTTGQVLTKASDEENDYKWADPQGGSGEGIKGDKGDKGEDGFSPLVDLIPAEDGSGVTLMISDIEDTHSYKILNGKDGKDGADGATGPQGEQGIQGEKGEKGDTGAKGDKGDTYTITQADYSAIADVVLSKMTNAEGVRY